MINEHRSTFEYVKPAMFFLVFIGFFNVTGALMNYMKADYYHRRSQLLFLEGDFRQAHNLSTKALKYNNNEPSYYVQKAKASVALVTTGSSSETDLKSEVIADIAAAVSLNSNNLVTKRDAVPIMYLLAVSKLKAHDEEVIDEEYRDKAAAYYNKLLSEYPTDVGLLAQVAEYQSKLQLTEDLERNMVNIQKLRPDLLNWYFN